MLVKEIPGGKPLREPICKRIVNYILICEQIDFIDIFRFMKIDFKHMEKMCAFCPRPVVTEQGHMYSVMRVF